MKIYFLMPTTLCGIYSDTCHFIGKQTKELLNNLFKISHLISNRARIQTCVHLTLHSKSSLQTIFQESEESVSWAFGALLWPSPHPGNPWGMPVQSLQFPSRPSLEFSAQTAPNYFL